VGKNNASLLSGLFNDLFIWQALQPYFTQVNGIVALGT
jgi:hypothetical protein